MAAIDNRSDHADILRLFSNSARSVRVDASFSCRHLVRGLLKEACIIPVDLWRDKGIAHDAILVNRLVEHTGGKVLSGNTRVMAIDGQGLFAILRRGQRQPVCKECV